MKLVFPLLLVFPLFSLAQEAKTEDPNRVVVVIEGTPWTARDLEQMTAALGGAIQMNFKTSPKAFVETFGLLLKLEALADQEKLGEKDPHKWRMLYNRALYLAQVRMDAQSSRVPILPADQLKYYEEHKQEFARARTRAIHLAFGETRDQAATEKLAQEIAKKAQAGADFAALAKQHSDDAESKAKGGEYPLIKPDDNAFPPAAKSAVFALKPGQVTDPVRQPTGFWIFKLEEFVVPPFEEVKAATFTRLQDKNLKEWMESVRNSVKVEFKDPAYFEKIAATPAPASAKP
ncbi:MAG: peptidylprolyl isomerase [Bryobacteraceae bacterium]|nr:peptidylprolyl isomerase [Bryobacteraceae bacterium]